MSSILIGSQAMKFHVPLNREPMDIDIITIEDSGLRKWFDKWSSTLVSQEGNTYAYKSDFFGTSKSNMIEVHEAQPGTSSWDFIRLVHLDDDSRVCHDYPEPVVIPSLNALFALKSSHKFKKDSPHFWKNLQDYHLMKAYGAEITPYYKDFYKKREKETYTYAHPKLNVSKDDFFKDDNIQYVYDHDWIHTVVALGDTPAYQAFLIDQVKVSKELFMQLPLEVQIRSVVEEAAVLAIERSLVPFPGGMTPKQAWAFAFSKVLTSITSGWWRAWAYDHAPQVLRMFPADYWDKFQSAAATNPVYHKKAT